MKEPQFKIFLDEKLIGSTALEKADIPMGVLFGQILFDNIDNAYSFLKSYCLQKQIGITDEKEDQFLTTRHIPNLKVIDCDSNEITGASVSIAGQGPVDFEITIEGVPHNILSFKFKHHINQYRNLFNQHYETDKIAEIGIDDKERLFIKPEETTFPLIYRTASEIHWDNISKNLYSPKPKEWTYLDWYKQIIAVIEIECNCSLTLTENTIWTNVSDELKNQIIES